MAKLTRDQLNKWNGQLKNGFGLDIMAYVAYGEKQAEKYIELPSGRKLRAVFQFNKVPGATHWHNTGLVKPVLALSVWRKTSTEGVIQSTCGTDYIDMSQETFSKKNYSILAGLTAAWDDARLLAVAREWMPDCN